MSYSIESEKSLILSLIKNNDLVDDVLSVLCAKDFYSIENRIIFESITRLAFLEEVADIISIDNDLSNNNEYQIAGGFGYLAEICKSYAVTGNHLAHAKIIKEHSIKRQISSINIDGDTAKEKIESLEKELDSIKQRLNNNDEWIVDAKKSIAKLIENIDKAANSENGISGLSTGFNNLDDLINGLEPKKMYVIGARPAMGKTAFAINIVDHLIHELDKSVVFFSLEMPHEDVTGRILSMRSKVDSIKMNRANLESHEWDSIGVSLGLYEKCKFSIVDKPAIGIIELKKYCNFHNKKYGSLDVIVIDYLQLMSEQSYKANRVQEVSFISRSLKEISKKYNCPVLALSQLNRTLESRIDKRPILSDLREAGDIEQDADVVMFLHREEVYNKNDYNLRGKAEVLVKKNRGGRIGDIAMNFNGSIYEFNEENFDASNY